MPLCRRIVDLLKAKGARDIALLVGGFIPPEDIPELKAIGVREVFREGTSLESIVQFIEKMAKERVAA